MNVSLGFRLTFVLLCLVCGISSKVTRDVKVQNYRCEKSKCGKVYDILHVKATKTGSNDTVHYLWSVIGLPAIVVGHNREPKTILNIDWNNGSFRDVKIEFVPKVSEISAIVFKDVSEYEDKDDDQNANKNIIGDIMGNFTWNFKGAHNLSDGASASFLASSAVFPESSLTLDLKAFTEKGYDTEMPQEPVNSDSVRFALGLEKLKTRTKHSRFSVGFAFVKNSTTAAPSFSTAKGIDDERTPGIFKLLNFVLPTKGNLDSFASWKPVSYNDKSRDHSKQTFLYNFPKGDNGKGTLSKFAGKIGYSIVDSVLSNTDAYAMKVSFGQKKDDFYTASKYRVWIGLFGHGTAPESKLSTKMYLILFLGLGIPMSLTLLGILTIFVKKLRGRKKLSYEQIN